VVVTENAGKARIRREAELAAEPIDSILLAPALATDAKYTGSILVKP
jgi:hypothetical protein